MKQYTLYLYTKPEECENHPNKNECYVYNCPNCKLSSYHICDEEGHNIEESINFNLSDIKNYQTEILIIETSDTIYRNHFAKYLQNEDNNYRLIDSRTNEIIKFNIDDLNLIMKLIDNYDEKIIDDLCELYKIDELLLNGTITDLNLIKNKIKKLANHKNASILLTGSFALINAISLQSFIDNPKFIPFLISGISLLCGIKNISNIQIDNIEITAGKRLIKKIKDKRNQNT